MAPTMTPFIKLGMAFHVALPNGQDAPAHADQGPGAKPMEPTPSPWGVNSVNQEGG